MPDTPVCSSQHSIQAKLQLVLDALMQCRRGFQLLQRMGWSDGQGLGASSAGRAVPLDVELKTKRTGLGIDEGCKRRAAAAKQKHQERGERDSETEG